MSYFKRYIKIVTLTGAFFSLPAFCLIPKNRQDYPFVTPIIHPVGQGTSVIIEGNVITNFHNIEPSFSFQFPLKNHLFLIDHEKRVIPVTQIAVLDAKADLAVVKATNVASSSGYSVNSFYDVAQKDRGKEAAIAGFLNGQFKVIRGTVGNVGEYAIEMKMIDGSSVESIDGLSGSPVFVNGRLAGMLSKSIKERKIAYFVPAHKIRELLARPTFLCSSVQCIKAEIEKLISLSVAGDEEASDRLRLYVEKNMSIMEAIQMFSRYEELQDRILTDGVQVMKLFTSYYEQFEEGNNMEQKIFSENILFDLAFKAKWPKAIHLKRKHNLRREAHEALNCNEAFSSLEMP